MHVIDTDNMRSIRKTFGETLVEVGRRYPNVMVGTAELMYPTRCDMFAKEFPERFYDVGVAEQNLFGMAAGLASCGKIPFAVSYANFSCLRAGEQIRNDISYTNFNVKVVALSCGVTFGVGGPSHQSFEDLAVMRALPRFVVLSPADAPSIEKAVWAAVEHEGPVYIRAGRDEEYLVYRDECPFEIGKANRLREGSDITIIATGYMVHEAVVAADLLAADGISAKVYDMHTIKPIDRAAIMDAMESTRAIITVEEHTIVGGLGTAVLEVLAETPRVPVYRIGINDTFPLIGPTFEVRKHLGLHHDYIASVARRVLDAPGQPISMTDFLPK